MTSVPASDVQFYGNILDAGDADWYIVTTSDQEQIVSGQNDNMYNFQAIMTSGNSEYGLTVYETACPIGNLKCPVGGVEGSGYDQYQAYSCDRGTGDNGSNHAKPADYRACRSPMTNQPYNNCDTLSKTYMVHVFRKTGTYSCTPYKLELSNGTNATYGWPATCP